MSLIITGVMLFVTAAIIANILQSYFNYRYETTPLVFVGIFSISLGITSLFTTQISLLLLNFQIVIIAVLYITTVILLARFWQPMQSLYGSHTVPVGYEGLIKPKLFGQIVKVFEIALQDTAAWLIVGGLFMLRLSFIEAAVAFTTVVAILHIPGLWVFGRVYGTYFLVMSTALAFLVPLFYKLGTSGFIYLYTLHLGGYILMYILMGCLRNKKIKVS